jgi:hypothetical protein
MANAGSFRHHSGNGFNCQQLMADPNLIHQFHPSAPLLATTQQSASFTGWL